MRLIEWTSLSTMPAPGTSTATVPATQPPEAVPKLIDRMLSFRSRLITSVMWLAMPVVSAATMRIVTRNAPSALCRQRASITR